MAKIDRLFDYYLDAWTNILKQIAESRGDEMAQKFVRSAQDLKDDEWYEAIADALRIIGRSWSDDITPEEDAFVLAYADEVATRPWAER